MKASTRSAVIASCLMLTACDDPTIISHVDRRPHMAMSDLWAMQDGRGIPVEIHGSPFRNVTDADLAGALRPPARAGQSTQFYARPVGSWQGGHAWRLVLHFNPRGGPNAYQDCRRSVEADTDEAPAESYSVNLSFCKDNDWQAHGYMRVLDAKAGELEPFSTHMQALMLAIFAENADADASR